MLRLFQLVFILSVAYMQINAQADTLRFDPDADASDSLEYELIVLDPGYDFFLASQPPEEYYSQSYYETWNSRYVIEWNYRYMDPLRYGDMYEVHIDYRHDIDYGLELNYKLFYYFRFFEKENAVDLLPGK